MSDRLPVRSIVFLLLLLAAVHPGTHRLFAADSGVVTDPTKGRGVSFELDVQPILSANGCNAGACHGKQRGQNGFQLSLLGFDSDSDFDALVHQARGRRLALRSPESSLLIRKATAEIPHGGGQKLEPDSDAYRTLVEWIGQGAPRKIEDEPALQSVELDRNSFQLIPGGEARLTVTARYSDGSSRDVTNLARYRSNDATVAKVDASGKLTAGSLAGETAIMARYRNHIQVASVDIPRDDSLPDGFYDRQPRANFIDEFVYSKLARMQIQCSDPAPDATFLRRAFTDVIGRPPSVLEARRFLDSTDPNHREVLIDYLLEQPEYVDHWANQWADLLRPNPYRVGIKAVLNYDNWIRQQFRDEVSYDEFVRRLITAKGSTWHNGAATLYRDRRSPDEITTLVSQLFLGVRLECAKCHHHPFEKWSQRDFYSFAAYFSKIGRKGKGLSPPISGSEELMFVASKGDVRHPVTGEVLSPRPLFGQAPIVDDSDPREALADWMTSTENDLFAKVQVNRVWAQLMGRGIVDPVDDLRSTNPPTNPELLNGLARHFQQSGYDQKALIRAILLSNAYSLSSEPKASNASDRLNYSRHYRQRFRAEVLMDAVALVTETHDSFAALPPESRANQVWTHRIDSVFLDTFGRPDENKDPPCERTTDSSVTQTLHLMNSRELDRRVRSDSGRAARLAKSDLSHSEVVEELYLAAFSRRPTESEQAYGETLLDDAGENRRGVIEDLLWAMVNTPEFLIQN